MKPKKKVVMQDGGYIIKVDNVNGDGNGNGNGNGDGDGKGDVGEES